MAAPSPTLNGTVQTTHSVHCTLYNMWLYTVHFVTVHCTVPFSVFWKICLKMRAVNIENLNLFSDSNPLHIIHVDLDGQPWDPVLLINHLSPHLDHYVIHYNPSARRYRLFAHFYNLFQFLFLSFRFCSRIFRARAFIV